MKNALSSYRAYFIGLPLPACRGGLGCVESRLRLKQSMYISITRPCPARRGARLNNGEMARGVASHCGSCSFNCQCNINDVSVVQCLRLSLCFKRGSGLTLCWVLGLIPLPPVYLDCCYAGNVNRLKNIKILDTDIFCYVMYLPYLEELFTRLIYEFNWQCL